MARWIVRALGLVVLALAAAGAWVYWGLTHHPDAASYATRAPGPARTSVRVTYLGVSTLLFDDGETQIMTDGFFSRPSPVELFAGKIAPNERVIEASLARAGVKKLAALIVCHSHYDHALDAAVVANHTGAVVVGSQSTANVARGGGVPEDRIRTPALGETLSFGKFRISLLASRHVPNGYPTGTIDAPLEPPARANAWKLGAAYAVLIEHDGRALLVNGSAGFEPGALDGHKVDTAYLGVGALGKTTDGYMSDYWRETATATGARRVVAIHWDNFARPLDQPLQPLPQLVDDFPRSMDFLRRRGRETGVRIELPQGWQTFDAFASP